ncbi:MAG: toxin of the YafQ-DinJ toxin-antitoxin system [Parcubacteria group bacterium]|nr:toxin of the YafQ-DinJ toxin-antitoxin system [Parcubacteria group bacterium]
MEAARHPRFEKKIARLPKPIRIALASRLELFLYDDRHPLLNDHALSGDRSGQRSINITGDWRLIYERIDTNLVLLLDIDTHHNLYGT